MAKHLKSKIEDIELLISSPATRAQRTMRFFASAYPNADIIKDDRIYEAFANDLMSVIHDLSDEYQSAMMFGHNPSFTSFFNKFSKNELDNLPTCGIFSLSSHASTWRDVKIDNTVVDFLIYPKMFKRS